MDYNAILLRLIEIEELFNNCYDGRISLKRLYQSKIKESDNIIRDTLIAHYTSKGYSYLNKNLIDCNQNNNEYINQYAHLLNKVLDELPNYQNKEIYRWNNIHQDGWSFLIKNQIRFIQIPQFWSTSKICRSDREQFIIKTNQKSRAYDISHIANNYTEDEVLFKSNSVFAIKECTNKIIYLDEIDYSTKENYGNILFMKNNFWI